MKLVILSYLFTLLVAANTSSCPTRSVDDCRIVPFASTGDDSKPLFAASIIFTPTTVSSLVLTIDVAASDDFKLVAAVGILITTIVVSFACPCYCRRPWTATGDGLRLIFVTSIVLISSIHPSRFPVAVVTDVLELGPVAGLTHMPPTIIFRRLLSTTCLSLANRWPQHASASDVPELKAATGILWLPLLTCSSSN
uniref:Uncharacterized protein n=1 Tax=Oryza sativa subsp. japonica TaxID=39947 RepID=Q6Z6T7_ORYSJ|nr:hypothetical protein [Oryza sativa Japonica Group]